MRRPRPQSLIMAGALALLLSCAERHEPAASTDLRTPLHLPAEGQHALRTEMRTMLASLNRILEGLAREDTAAMAGAARASGLATAADPHLEQLLPAEFLRMGVATHRQFDTLAAAIQAGIPRDSVVDRLGRLTGSCVACHETYRLSQP